MRKNWQRDQAEQIRFFMAAALIFFALHLIQAFSGVQLMPLSVQAFISILGGMFATLVGKKIADLSGWGLYGQKKANFTVREQLAGELEKIKYYKREGDYGKALQLINDVLSRDPEFAEAVFLKAQILHHGFNNIEAAKTYLKKIQQIANPDAAVNRWARGYLEDLNANASINLSPKL